MRLNDPENLIKLLILSMTKRYFRKLQNKLTKIVVVFVVAAAPYKCFAIFCHFINLKQKQLIDL